MNNFFLFIYIISSQIFFFNFASNNLFDKTFNKTGKLILEIGKFSFANSVQLTKDKKIILGGISDQKFLIVRLNQDGSLDKTFGIDGKVFIFVGKNPSLNAILIKENKIYLTGSANDNFIIIKLNSDGLFDRTFANEGKLIFEFGISINSNDLSIDKNNKVIVTGDSYFRYLNLIKVNKDGRFDTAFNDGEHGAGKIVMKFDTSCAGNGVAVQEDGKILVSGSVSGFFSVFRFQKDGALDLSFGPFGLGFVTILPGIFAQGNSILIQNDGKIVIGGQSDFKFVLVRLNNDGSLDKTFNNKGFIETKINNKSAILAIDQQSWDKKIIVSGYSVDSLYKFTLARYNVDGSFDNSFGNNGILIVNFNHEYLGDSANSLTIDQMNKKIIVSGYAGKKIAVIRLNESCINFTDLFLNKLAEKY